MARKQIIPLIPAALITSLSLTQGQLRAYELLNDTLDSRLNPPDRRETLDYPKGVGAFIHLLDENGYIKEHPEAYKKLPEITEEDFLTGVSALEVIDARYNPDKAKRSSKEDVKRATKLIVHLLDHEFKPFVNAVRVGTDTVPPYIRFADWRDDQATSGAKDKLHESLHFLGSFFRKKPDDDEDTAPQTDAEKAAKAAEKAAAPTGLSAFGWAVLLVPVLLTIGVIAGVIWGALWVYHKIHNFLFGKKKPEPEVVDSKTGKPVAVKSPWTLVSVIGITIMVLADAFAVAQLAAFLAPSFRFTTGYPWWYSPFLMCGALQTIWFARWLATNGDPWDLPELPVKKDPKEGEEKADKEHEEAGHEKEAEHAPAPEAEKGKEAHAAPAKKDKPAAHAPAAAHGHGHEDEDRKAIDTAIEERSKKLLLVIPGGRRGFILKNCLAATLLGTILCAYWFGNGEVLLGGALLAGGIFLLQLVLDMGMHWNTAIRFAWMQKFLMSVFGFMPKPIGAALLAGAVVVAIFSSQAQGQMPDRLHAIGDKLMSKLPEPTHAPAVAAPQAAPRTPSAAPVKTDVQKCEAKRVKLLAMPGMEKYCDTHSSEDRCTCKKN